MSKISQDIVLYTRNYRTGKTEAGRYPNLLHAVNLRPVWDSKEALFHHIKVGERESSKTGFERSEVMRNYCLNRGRST